MHSFTTTLFKDNGICQSVTVSFTYFLPEHHRQWQDPNLGSISLLEVVNLEQCSILSSLSINEHIAIRHECWAYIEHHQLNLADKVSAIT